MPFDKKCILPYNFQSQAVKQNLSLSIDRFCNSITFINQGADIITINGSIILYPGTVGTNSGESFSFGGNIYEIYSGRIDIAFTTTVNPLCTVIQKIYLLESEI